jgi:uncharacterized Zn-binding protein involved in type VI secretion
MAVSGVVNKAADAVGGKAGLPGKAAGQAGQQARSNAALPDGAPKESATDVARHAWDGLWSPNHAKNTAGVDSLIGAVQGGARSPGGLSGIGTSASQSVSQIGTDIANIGKAQGALQTVGAVFATLTSIEQLISAPFAAIPFPAFPALRITDMDIGLPHAHAHPPNLPPPPPIPLPSTGPVIPIPFVSGANKVLINSLPAARCGDMGLGIWCGGYVPLYEVFLGSASVWIEGARAARLAVDVTNHCIFSARKGPQDQPLGPFVGFTVMGSANVMIGGVPMPSLTSMAMGAMFKQAFKWGGKAVTALCKRSKTAAAAAAKLAAMSKKAKQSWKNLFNKKAIEKSGMVESHAKAISQVAQDTDQILMFQTVNPKAKELIENGAATKGMDIKGKSDINGQIPMDQSKSAKGAKMGEEWVDKQNKALDDLVNPKNPDGTPKLNPDGTPVKSDYTTIPGKDGNPVLAKYDQNGNPVPVTSDYDMLATGSKQPPETPKWDPEKGNVTPTQEKTIDKINDAVDHPGGNVVHHGPENQYPGKGPAGGDGPKYPVTAFEPDGSIKTLNDEKALKDYINTKKYEGYNGLDPDPSWGWEKGPDGFYK